MNNLVHAPVNEIKHDILLRWMLTMAQTFDFARHSAKQKEMSYYDQRFILHPKSLRSLKLPVSLNWVQLRFSKANVKKIALKPGVYAFVVGDDDTNLPSHGYVLYIGQTGAKAHDRTLRDRAKEYLAEKKNPNSKRIAIREFLNKWQRCLFFHFAPVDPLVTDLLSIETKLNDALLPPYSSQDFSPEVRTRKQVWEKT